MFLKRFCERLNSARSGLSLEGIRRCNSSEGNQHRIFPPHMRFGRLAARFASIGPLANARPAASERGLPGGCLCCRIRNLIGDSTSSPCEEWTVLSLIWSPSDRLPLSHRPQGPIPFVEEPGEDCLCCRRGVL